jgi:glycosyltransferase involved in cell wall biosynthesis
MLRPVSERPRRVLMTLDAVGGVWRYALDLASSLAGEGIETILAGFGPRPSAHQRNEAGRVGRLVWCDLPLDWLVEDEAALDGVADAIGELAARHSADLVHLNLPSQAHGLRLAVPAIVASHSCVPSWFRAVRGEDVPANWAWQKRLNASGLLGADAVLVPSRSHGRAIEACYGPIAALHVIPNATQPLPSVTEKVPVVLAAGRWWDEGKNGVVLDRAAGWVDWPVLMAGAAAGPNGQLLNIRNARALGELSASRLQPWLAGAAIVASPSIYEPFGLVALEGATAGAALVLSDIPTYRELWDGAAFFAEPRDPSAWIEALNGLARDRDWRRRLGAAARERAGRFTPAAQRDAVLSAYVAALDHSPRLVA